MLHRLHDAAKCRLTLLVAPAGFGKSTALRQVLSDLPGQVVVFHATREIETGRGFARGFGRALARSLAQPEVDTILRGVAGESPDNVWHLGAALLEVIGEREVTIAIDGLTWPMISNTEIRALLGMLIEGTPQSVRWMVASRASAELPIASWMAYGLLESIIGESDLAFSIDEAFELARSIGAEQPAAEIDALYALTQGWPAALALALRAGISSVRFRDVAGDPRHRVLEFLAEQVFRDLEESAREFMLATCVFPAIDLDVVTELYPDAATVIERIRQQMPLISVESANVFTYQPLFRHFLEYELRRRGEELYRARLTDGSSLSERKGRLGDALALAVQAKDSARIIRLLEEHGFDLLDHGEGEIVATAAALVETQCQTNPIVLALRARHRASTGDHARAIKLFERSIENARYLFERLRLTHLFVLELAKRNDPRFRQHLERYVALLEEIEAVDTLPLEFEASACGTLALAHSVLGQPEHAREWIKRALSLVETSEDAELHASIYHQASYIAYVTGDIPRASRLAATATDLALESRLFPLAARSWSVRYGIAIGVEDDPGKALEALREMAVCASRAGDRFLFIQALAAQADIHAQAGDGDAVAHLAAEIERREKGLEVQTTSLLSALAMRAAWNGDFQVAYEMTSCSAADQPTVLRQALRWAEISIYASGAGLREEAVNAISHASNLARTVMPKGAEDRRRMALTLSACALASVVVGHNASANAILAELERSRREHSPRTRALAEAARALYLEAEIGSHEAVGKALEALRSAHYGGYARLIEALPIARRTATSAISLLTKAEVQILVALGRGGSSTRVAAELQRSVNTVNAHVKSILRKLDCTTRYEALEIARDHGLIA